MDALDFAELQRIDNKTDISVAGKPGTVVLVKGLVAIADTVFFDTCMAAYIKNRWRRSIEAFRYVEISGHVQAGPGLKMYVFHGEFIVVDCAGNNGFKVGSRRQRLKAHHLEKLLSINPALAFPIF